MRRTVVLALMLALAIPAMAADDPYPFDALEAGGERLTLAFTGDVLIHSSVWQSAQRHGRPYDFRPMFTPVRHIIAGADLAICHLESPVSPESVSLSGFPRFNAPREILQGLVYAGFRGCTTASNHSNDQGPEGIVATLFAMAEEGLRQAGMRVDPDDSLIGYYHVGETLVANISATYGLNGLDLPASRAYMVQMLDGGQILSEARVAREAGADIVVVSIHCCVEYRTMPTDAQRALAHRLIASDDIDIIVTHHAHVVSPVEWVGGKPIFHGLGNFLSNQSARAGLPANTQDGVIGVAVAERWPEGWRFVEVSVVPTWVGGPDEGHVVRLARPGSVSYQRTMAAINMLGADVGTFSMSPLPDLLSGRLD